MHDAEPGQGAGTGPLGRAPIRTAVVGFGTSGRVFHAPLIFADARYSLDMIVTVDPARRAQAARLYPQARLCAGADELFAQAQDLDLVVIGSPPRTHALLAHTALAAGLAVVVEKPFAVTAAEGRQLVAHAASCGRPLTVFQNRRWDGDFLTAAGLVAAGTLGQVYRFESRFETYKPRSAKAWKAEAASDAGGGILYDLGTHLVDQAIQLFGPVTSFHAELARHGTAGAGEDDAFLSLLHESGVRSQLWMNSLSPQPGPRFRLTGSEAGYTKWGLDPQEKALDAGRLPTDSDYGLETEESWGLLGRDPDLRRKPTERGAYPQFYARLAAALLEGAPLPVDPADAVAVLQIIEDAHAASRAGG